MGRRGYPAVGFVLKIPLLDVVSMQCRQESLEGAGEIKLRRLVKQALRMRPSRMMVGEVRQEESLDLSRYTTYPMGYSGNTSTPASPERPSTRGSAVTRLALSGVCSARSVRLRRQQRHLTCGLAW